MTQPTTESFHVDAALTSMSVAVLQDPGNFIAPNMFSNVPVAKKSDEYFVFDRSYFARSEARKRAPGTRVAEGGFELSTQTYTCEERGVSYPIPDQVKANADAAAPPEVAAQQWLTHQALLEQEIDFVSTFMGTGVWGTDITGSAGTPGSGQVYQWSDYTNSDPIGDVRTGIDTILQNTGLMPNVLGISRPVFSALIDHPDIQGRINGGATTSQPSIANRNLLAQIFEVDEVTVGQAIQNTADEGQTADYSFIMGKDALLTYRQPSPSIMSPAAGYRFSWTGYLPGMNEFGFVIESKRRDEEDSDLYRYRSHYTNKLVASELGYFWDSIVA